jgi:hypothetical protein
LSYSMDLITDLPPAGPQFDCVLGGEAWRNFQYKWISKNSGKESWCTESEFKKRELMIKQKTLHPTIQASAVQLQAQAAAAQTATEIAQAARIANLELQVGALAQEGMQRTEEPPPPPPPVQSAQEKYIATILAKHSLS